MKKLTYIFILLMSFVYVQDALACSYIYQEPQERYDSTPVVFVGTIIKLQEEGGLNGTREVTFDVQKTYKGPQLSEQLTLTTGANSAMCGYDEGTLSEGDIWVIYTFDTESFNSSPGNQKYNTVGEARTAVEVFIDASVDEEDQVMCPLNYDPVCGQKDTGIRCVTTPCASTENKTYGNTCQLNADKAEFLYKGECKVEQKEEVIKPEIQDDTNEEVEPVTDSVQPIDTIEREALGLFVRIINFIKALFGF